MKKCPFCAEEIQDDAIVCKHCKHDLSPSALAAATIAQKNSASRGKIRKGCLFLTLGIIALFVIVALSSGHKDTDNTNNVTQSPHPAIGEQGYLRLPNTSDPTQVICLGETKDEADQIGKALLANDMMGLLEIPGAYCVSNGTQVLVIDQSWGWTRVRILKGVRKVDDDKVGRSGWVVMEWVVKK